MKSTIALRAAERAELLGLERGQPGKPVLQGGEDFDALDRVDPEVGVELHVEIEHLGGVSRLLRDDLDQDRGRRFAGRELRWRPEGCARNRRCRSGRGRAGHFAVRVIRRRRDRAGGPFDAESMPRNSIATSS